MRPSAWILAQKAPPKLLLALSLKSLTFIGGDVLAPSRIHCERIGVCPFIRRGINNKSLNEVNTMANFFKGMITNTGIIGEILQFLWARKMWWLIPMVTVL